MSEAVTLHFPSSSWIVLAGLDPAIQPASACEPKEFWMAGSGAGHDASIW